MYFATFAIATGIRMRNITRLTRDRVDLTRRVLWVEAQDSKSGHPISIPLCDDAIAVLNTQKGRHRTRVFTCRGKPCDVAGIRAMNRRVIAWNKKETRLAAKENRDPELLEKYIHPHLFRYTFASWHVMAGTTLFDLMKLGGWRKIDSVTRYAHLSADHLQSAAGNRASIEGLFVSVIKRT